MADNSVFISYSTQDTTIGRRLYNALSTPERVLWMDWKSIPLTADWWNEIKHGIETSDNFIFLISPNSIASPICHLEIQYACSQKKRVIPVLITQTDERAAYADLLTRDLNDLQRALLGKQDLIDLARDNWKILSSIQWINLARDGFDAGFAQLVQAIDTDLEYVKQHTRLLIRAHEWNSHGRNRSYLLSGDDLRQAEMWRAESADKLPSLTDLQNQYLHASRRGVNTRIRNLLVGTFTALIISTLLAIVSVAQTIEANRNAAQAEAFSHQEATSAALAEARLLDVQSVQSLYYADLAEQQIEMGYPQVARELALNASSFYPAIDHPESSQALQNVLAHSFQPVFVIEHDSQLIGASWLAGDNPALLSWDTNGRVQLNDGANGHLIETFEHGAPVSDAANSFDNEYLLAAVNPLGNCAHDCVYAAVLWRTTGERLKWMPFNSKVSVQWQPEALHYLTITDTEIALWDVNSDIPEYTLDLAETTIAEVLWSPEGSHIAVRTSDGYILIVRGNDGAILHTFYHGRRVEGMRWNPSGTQLVTYGEQFVVWDIASGEPSFSRTQEFVVTGAVWNADESKIMTWAWGGYLGEETSTAVWDAHTGEPLLTLNGELAMLNAAWVRSENEIMTWEATGTVMFWGANQGQRGIGYSLEGMALDIQSSPDNKQFIAYVLSPTFCTADCAASFALIDLEQSQPMTIRLSESIPIMPVWHPVQSRIAIPTGAQQITVFDTRHEGQIATFSPIHAGDVEYAALNADGSRGAILHSSRIGLSCTDDCEYTITVIDTDTDTLQSQFSATGWWGGAEWHADGHHLLVWTRDNGISLWNTDDGSLVWHADDTAVLDAAWYSSDAVLVRRLGDNAVYLLDAATGQQTDHAVSEQLTANEIVTIGRGANPLYILRTQQTDMIWDPSTDLVHPIPPFTKIFRSQESQLFWTELRPLSEPRVFITIVGGTIGEEVTATPRPTPTDNLNQMWDEVVVWTFAQGDEDIQRWLTLGDPTVRWQQFGSTPQVSISPDKSLVVLWDDNNVTVWDARTSSLIMSLPQGGEHTGISWSDNGEMLIVSTRYASSALHAIELWSPETESLLQRINLPMMVEPSAVFVTRHDTRIIIAHQQGIAVWPISVPELRAAVEAIPAVPLSNQQRAEVFLPTLIPTATRQITAVNTPSSVMMSGASTLVRLAPTPTPNPTLSG